VKKLEEIREEIKRKVLICRRLNEK